jgi:hypothetical protein
LNGLPEHLLHWRTTPAPVRVVLQLAQLGRAGASSTEHVCSNERATPVALDGASSGSTAAAVFFLCARARGVCGVIFSLVWGFW